MTRRSLLRITAVVFGLPVLLLVCFMFYLRFADLSGWREDVAGLLSKRLGREVAIAGEFKPIIGRSTRLTATDITLANPDWCRDADMASIQRLSIEVDLLSLLFGPLTIEDVAIRGVQVNLEKKGDGRANWEFALSTDTPRSGRGLDLVLRHAQIDDLRLTWRDPSRPAPLRGGIERFESTEDADGMLDIDLTGKVDNHDLSLSGRLGTLTEILTATAPDYDLSGALDTVRVSSEGHLTDLKTLAGVDLTAEVEGENLSDLRSLLDVPPELTGPFDLTLKIAPAATGSAVQLSATASGMTAAASGTVDSLATPKVVDATVNASGPSIRTVGSLTGITDLPDEAFSVSGGVRWEGFPITLQKVEIRVGDNSLAAHGALGAPPEMAGTDFSLRGEGPDIASISALAGIALPHDPFSVDCRVQRVDGGLEIRALDAKLGRTELAASGTIGDPPEYAGTTLEVHAAGPNLAHFDRLLGINLPAVEFSIDGRLTQGDRSITVDGVKARIGTATMSADGSLHTGTKLSGTSLQIDAQGTDASQITLLAGFTNLPREPWSASGTLTFLDTGYQLGGVSATFGSLHAEGGGLISAAHRSIGTHLDLRIDDSDLSHAMAIFKVSGFPRLPVRAAGKLTIEEDGYGLDNATATAGDVAVAVDGVIGRGSGIDGTRGSISVHGPRLSTVGRFVNLDRLPDAPFSVEGEVRVTGGTVGLENIVSELDGNHLTLDGTLAPVKGLVGTDVTLDARGPDLRRASRLAAGLVEVPELPAGAFTLATRLRIDGEGYEVDDLNATLDHVTATVDGRLSTAADMVGTDLTVNADGPDASVFSALSGVDLPAAPFKVNGRLQRTDTAFLFDRVTAEVGGHTVTLHGSLGERPRLVGTELTVEASGPGTALVAELTGLHKLPDEPFRIVGHFEGTSEKFTADDLEATLGPSDLNGSIEVDTRAKPDVTAQLRSKHLDLAWLSGPPEKADGTPPDTTATGKKSKTARLISDTPIDFGWLQRANGAADLTIGELQMPVERFHDVELEARLEDGRLDVHHLAMAGSRGGSGSGSLVLEPAGNGYRGDLELDMDKIHFTFPGEESRSTTEEPPFDLNIRLQAEGATPHEMAASSNGSIQLVFGKGVMDNRVLDFVSRDILLTLLKAFNPFAKDEKATELECAIALFTLQDGVMTLDPMAMQSNKMTMLGGGTIDFTTEKLNLDWVTKPRKGIGLSASMLTNPYIKLGGTLAHPAIHLKGAQAVASTGVAVATLGISLVAKGMLDRATAEKKVCTKALEEIAQRTRDTGAGTTAKKK